MRALSNVIRQRRLYQTMIDALFTGAISDEVFESHNVRLRQQARKLSKPGASVQKTVGEFAT